MQKFNKYIIPVIKNTHGIHSNIIFLRLQIDEFPWKLLSFELSIASQISDFSHVC